MSSVVYEQEFYGFIWTKEVILGQLEKAKNDLENSESNLIRIEIACLAIEIDRNDDSIWVIA